MVGWEEVSVGEGGRGEWIVGVEKCGIGGAGGGHVMEVRIV